MNEIVDYVLEERQINIRQNTLKTKTISFLFGLINRYELSSSLRKWILENNLFDVKYYLIMNPDLVKYREDLMEHYFKFGWKEGRNPSYRFNTNYYISNYYNNPEFCPLTHYYKQEVRDSYTISLNDEYCKLIRKSNFFNLDFYNSQDDSNTFRTVSDGIFDYLQFGASHGKNPCSKFNTEFYVKTYKDVKKSMINPLVHYLKYGQIEGRFIDQTNYEIYIYSKSSFFDKKYYLEVNEDVKKAGYDPFFHYYHHGWKEGRWPSSEFNPHFYIKKYMNESEGNPIVHYENVGRRFDVSVNEKTHNCHSEPIHRTIEKYNLLRLNNFLNNVNSKIEFPYYDKPIISIILVLYNKIELTFNCLESIKAYTDIPYEIIIVDNDSTDNTKKFLTKTLNLNIIYSQENLGFLKACNIASRKARGEYLLFLNNDTHLLPNTISELYRTFQDNDSVGVAGGKLVFPDGRLQEAGGILFNEGNAQSFGRNDNPLDYKYSYTKEVDFVTGALLLTPKSLFLELEGFDELYTPAYSEEVDYCLSVHKRGLKIIYNPSSVLLHHEFGSTSSNNALKLQKENIIKLKQKWDKELVFYEKSINFDPTISRSFQLQVKNRILVVDDRIPEPELGSGYPRSLDIIRTLNSLEFLVTLFPLQFPYGSEYYTQLLQSEGIEVVYDHNKVDRKLNFKKFLEKNSSRFDIMLISRPHNMKEIISLNLLNDFNGKIIYDCEALFSMRNIIYKEKILLEKLTNHEKNLIIDEEIQLASHADSILTVTQRELDIYKSKGVMNGGVVGHMRTPQIIGKSFTQRDGILFVGGILNDPSPNEDALLNFVKNIFPIIQKENKYIKLYVVGNNKLKKVWDLQSENIIITGRVESVIEYYEKSKICIIPTRYAAGIPYKFHEAASLSIPMVLSPLIHEQVNGVRDYHYLVGDSDFNFAKQCLKLYKNKNLWNKLQNNISELVLRDCSETIFRKNLDQVVRNLLDSKKNVGNINDK